LFLDDEAQAKDSDAMGPKVCFSYITKGVLGEVSTSLNGAFAVVRQMNKSKWFFERSKSESRSGIEDKHEEGAFRNRAYQTSSGWKTETSTEVGASDSLLSILEARRGFQASDPRDRVFAHLGLVEGLDIRVDYEMRCHQVFQMMAK
jgi:hypothetical protein